MGWEFRQVHVRLENASRRRLGPITYFQEGRWSREQYGKPPKWSQRHWRLWSGFDEVDSPELNLDTGYDKLEVNGADEGRDNVWQQQKQDFKFDSSNMIDWFKRFKNVVGWIERVNGQSQLI